jgi:hypothetical protein
MSRPFRAGTSLGDHNADTRPSHPGTGRDCWWTLGRDCAGRVYVQEMTRPPEIGAIDVRQGARLLLARRRGRVRPRAAPEESQNAWPGHIALLHFSEASVSIVKKPAPALDDVHSSVRRSARRSLLHGEGGVSRVLGETLASRPRREHGRCGPRSCFQAGKQQSTLISRA